MGPTRWRTHGGLATRSWLPWTAKYTFHKHMDLFIISFLFPQKQWLSASFPLPKSRYGLLAAPTTSSDCFGLSNIFIPIAQLIIQSKEIQSKMVQKIQQLVVFISIQFLLILFATINCMQQDEKDAQIVAIEQQSPRNSGRFTNLNIRKLLSRKRDHDKKRGMVDGQQLERAQSLPLPPYALRAIHSNDHNDDNFQTVIRRIDWQQIRRILLEVPRERREEELKRIAKRTMLADFFRKNDKLDFGRIVKALEEGHIPVETPSPHKVDSPESENAKVKGKESADSDVIHSHVATNSHPAVEPSRGERYKQPFPQKWKSDPSTPASQFNGQDSDHDFDQRQKHHEHFTGKVPQVEYKGQPAVKHPKDNLESNLDGKLVEVTERINNLEKSDSSKNLSGDDEKNTTHSNGNDSEVKRDSQGMLKDSNAKGGLEDANNANHYHECKTLLDPTSLNSENEEGEILDSFQETSENEPISSSKQSVVRDSPRHFKAVQTVDEGEVLQENLDHHHHHHVQSAVAAKKAIDGFNGALMEEEMIRREDITAVTDAAHQHPIAAESLKPYQKHNIEENDVEMSADGTDHHDHPYGSSPKVKERGSAGSFRLDSWRGRHTQSMPEGLQNIHEVMAKESMNEVAEENHLNSSIWKETFKERLAMFQKVEPKTKGKNEEFHSSGHLQQRKSGRDKLVPGCKITGNANVIKEELGINSAKMDNAQKVEEHQQEGR